eukprot:244408-Rhodomonas_salina.3
MDGIDRESKSSMMLAHQQECQDLSLRAAAGVANDQRMLQTCQYSEVSSSEAELSQRFEMYPSFESLGLSGRRTTREG